MDTFVNNTELQNKDSYALMDLLKPQYAFKPIPYHEHDDNILYISDLHLDSHCELWGVDMAKLSGTKEEAFIELDKHKNKFISTVLKLYSDYSDNEYLYEPHYKCDPPIEPYKTYCYFTFIGGDIADNPYVYEYFLKTLTTFIELYEYKTWQKQKKRFKRFYDCESIETEYDKCLTKTKNTLNKKITDIQKWYKYSPKRHGLKTYDELIEHAHLKDKPDFVKNRLQEIKRLEEFIQSYENNRINNIAFINKTRIFKHAQTQYPIIVVLGNHELSTFDTVNEAVSFYSQLCEQYGITLLHNKSYKMGDSFINDIKMPFNLVGGVGFAKYNEEFNASNMVTARLFTRNDEIFETNAFLKVYNDALKSAIQKEQPLIVLTHFPTKDWLPDTQYDAHCIYFTGHTHRNVFFNDERGITYANRQVGYTDEIGKLGIANVGVICNPFINHLNGYYEITVRQYETFLKYSGESYKWGLQAINNRVNGIGLKGKTIVPDKLYMVKHDGFYGFFLIGSETRICAGGAIRKASKNNNIQCIYSQFSGVINNILNALTPFRKFEEQISDAIKSMGFSGKIHGCIIDIDYSHHIMINPQNGNLTFYYSPCFGFVQDLGSFENVIKDIEASCIESIDDGFWIKDHQEKLLKCQRALSNKGNTSLMLQTQLSPVVGKLQMVETSGGMYSISRKIYELQRLFDSNILRRWFEE